MLKKENQTLKEQLRKADQMNKSMWEAYLHLSEELRAYEQLAKAKRIGVTA